MGMVRRRGRSADTLGRSARRGAGAVDAAAATLRDLTEMQLAAARTIGFRLPMIAAATRDPRLLANPELARMVAEKVEAFTASAVAVGPLLATPPLHAGRWLNDQAAVWSHGFGALAPALSPFAVWYRWRRLAGDLAVANAAYGAAMLGALAELGAAALAPVHKAATGNARRLGRR